jgi:hypothetical protein
MHSRAEKACSTDFCVLSTEHSATLLRADGRSPAELWPSTCRVTAALPGAELLRTEGKLLREY